VPHEEFVRWVVDAEIGLFNLRATGLIPAINSYEDADTYKQILQRLESAHLEKYEKSDFSSATRHAILTGIRVGIGSAKFQWTAESLEAARIATQSKAAPRETIPTSPSQSAGAVASASNCSKAETASGWGANGFASSRFDTPADHRQVDHVVDIGVLDPLRDLSSATVC